MTPDGKKNTFDIIEENKRFTMECFLELRKTCNIPTKDMQNMRVCYECAKEKSNHLERTLPELASGSRDSTALPLQEDVARAEASLRTYQVKPEGMKGGELLAQMIQFGENHNWNKGK